MRIVVSIFLIAITAFVMGIYLPWWSIAIAAFIIPLFIQQSSLWAFISGFVALFLLWGVMSWIISSNNQQVFAHKMAMLILSNDSPALLVFVTALLGALVAGFAALSGNRLRKIIVKA